MIQPDKHQHPPAPTEEEPLPPPDGPTELLETTHEIGEDNDKIRFAGFRLDVHNPVFWISGTLISSLILLVLLFNAQAGAVFENLRQTLTTAFDSFFLLSANIFVVICVGILLSPLGRVRLGGPYARPDFNYLAWFAMLFAAGMGIGLMFYSVAEPISHYDAAIAGIQLNDAGIRTDSAPLQGAAADPTAARHLAMAATIFHWGLHPWAIYGIVALALALFAYNKGLPLTMRSAFYPLIGERVWGWPGHVIDILSVLATLFGLATSLGIGVQQASAGLTHLYSLPDGIWAQIILIILITSVALGSIVVGIHNGVRRLSEVNLMLAIGLLLFVIVVGPTTLILTGFFENLWSYATHLPALSDPFARPDSGYSQGWTAFYWAWWISWSPFVGMFIARVSRGRTVREFLAGVLLVPTLASVLWLTAFGETALNLTIKAGEVAIQNAPLELKLFETLALLPYAEITSVLAIALVLVFFVTSSDSGSLVIDTITAGGKAQAPVAQRVFWASFEGVTAIVLLLGGGLTALQAMVISTGFPFTFILLVLSIMVIHGLRNEPRVKV